MGFARKASKLAVLPLGSFTRRQPNDLSILLYHRVGVGSREIDLDRQAFDRQIQELAALRRVLPLDEAVSSGRGGIVVTFDDGYRDFVDHVVPVLANHRIPAVLYLATGLLDGSASGADLGPPLTWGALAEAVASGFVTIGAHTHSHADLSIASATEARDEMRKSRDLIEDRLGLPCRHFAYPWAVGSEAAEAATRTLFDSAALHVWKTNRTGRTDPYALGRVPILRSDGPLFFRAKVEGRLDGEALLYRALRKGPWKQPDRGSIASLEGTSYG